MAPRVLISNLNLLGCLYYCGKCRIEAFSGARGNHRVLEVLKWVENHFLSLIGLKSGSSCHSMPSPHHPTMSPRPSFKPFLHAAIFLLVSIGSSAAPLPLFNGKTPEGWEGDTSLWHIEDETLTAGSLERKQLKNDFFATVKDYSDFELTLKWRLVGTEGFVNGGIQFRSFRIPNNHEMWGYQADLGAGYDGALYDESRRGMLLKPSKEVYEKARKPLGEWNEYRIRAEGDRIQLWLNGVQTADYTETSPEIPRTGKIALQIHGNAVAVVRFKDIEIEDLAAPAP